MGAPYIGDDTHLPATVTLLDDADLAAPAAAMWGVPDEAALDGVAYIASRVLTFQPSHAGAGAAGQKVNITATFENVAARWTQLIDTSIFPLGWINSDTTTVGGIAFEITPPHAMARGARIDVRINGKHGAGHGAVLPATLPSVLIVLSSDGGHSTLSTTDDPSATVGAYDQPHLISCPAPDNDPLARGETLWVVVRGETGANAVNSTTALYDITATWTSDDIP